MTDEELSRVLTAHEAGGLQRGGNGRVVGYPCCIQQARWSIQKLPTRQVFTDITEWFDSNYQSTWTADEFLRQLERRGLA